MKKLKIDRFILNHGLGQLRAQIMAYKQLSRTQHIDPNLLNAVKGNIRQPGPGPSANPGAPPTGPPRESAPPATAPPPAQTAPGSTGSLQSPAGSTSSVAQPVAKTEPEFTGQNDPAGQPTPPTSTPSGSQSNPPTPIHHESRPSTAPPEKDESDKENKPEIKAEAEENEPANTNPETPKVRVKYLN